MVGSGDLGALKGRLVVDRADRCDHNSRSAGVHLVELGYLLNRNRSLFDRHSEIGGNGLEGLVGNRRKDGVRKRSHIGVALDRQEVG